MDDAFVVRRKGLYALIGQVVDRPEYPSTTPDLTRLGRGTLGVFLPLSSLTRAGPGGGVII